VEKKQDDFDKRIKKFIDLLQKESNAPYEACEKEAYRWISLFSSLRWADDRLRNLEQEWQKAVDILPGFLQAIEKHAEALGELLDAMAVEELQNHIARFYAEACISKVERQAVRREQLNRKRNRPPDSVREDLIILMNRIKTEWEKLAGRKATIQTPRDDISWEPTGPVLKILQAFFALFGIDRSKHTMKEMFYQPHRKRKAQRLITPTVNPTSRYISRGNSPSQNTPTQA
jgi:hypothetical protein